MKYFKVLNEYLKMETKKVVPKTDYLAHINGPILFTAPHSTRLYRGGVEYNEKQRIHPREAYTAELAVRWASKIEGSFCVWSKSTILSYKNLDPNYLKKSKFEKSPFHQSLHAFRIKNIDKPLLHIDIHGKKDSNIKTTLDLGVECLLVKWTDEQKFCKNLISALTDNINKAFASSHKMQSSKAYCDNEPYLNGYWGDVDIYTMTEQAVDLAIPSLQLEIPLSMREELFINKSFSDSFYESLIDTYNSVIIPWFNSKKVQPIYSIKIYKMLVEISKENLDKIISEFEQI